MLPQGTLPVATVPTAASAAIDHIDDILDAPALSTGVGAGTSGDSLGRSQSQSRVPTFSRPNAEARLPAQQPRVTDASPFSKGFRSLVHAVPEDSGVAAAAAAPSAAAATSWRPAPPRAHSMDHSGLGRQQTHVAATSLPAGQPPRNAPPVRLIANRVVPSFGVGGGGKPSPAARGDAQRRGGAGAIVPSSSGDPPAGAVTPAPGRADGGDDAPCGADQSALDGAYEVQPAARLFAPAARAPAGRGTFHGQATPTAQPHTRTKATTTVAVASPPAAGTTTTITTTTAMVTTTAAGTDGSAVGAPSLGTAVTGGPLMHLASAAPLPSVGAAFKPRPHARVSFPATNTLAATAHDGMVLPGSHATANAVRRGTDQAPPVDVARATPTTLAFGVPATAAAPFDADTNDYRRCVSHKRLSAPLSCF